MTHATPSAHALQSAHAQRLPRMSDPSGFRHSALFSLTALVLAGCASSVDLPPWSPPVQGAVAAPAATSPAPAAPSQTVVTSPVPPPSVQGAPVITAPVLSSPVSPPPAVQALPYGAAVAARFPAPSIVYNTPGLQPGRTAFTTATELRSLLRDQSLAATRSAGLQAGVLQIGQTQRGESIEALVLARAAGTDAAALQANGRPTVLLIGQQHGDEPAGAEALLVVARELSQGLLMPLLERINVVVVPRANPDGAAAAQRLTAENMDLDRDHLLLASPEAQALARLARDYQPAVVLDSQEYAIGTAFQQRYGAVQKFDALLQYATVANHPEFLTKADEEWFRRPLLQALKAQGLSTEWHYALAADPADTKLAMGGTSPATSRNAYGLKNAVSLLVESRGSGMGRADIQRRVHTQVTAISSVLASTAQRAGELRQLRPYLDREVGAMACREQAVVQAAPVAAQYELAVLDPVTGADRKIIVDWDSSLALRTVKSRVRPCGYWLSANAAQAVERLRLHGVQVMQLTETGTLLGDSYRETARTPDPRTSLPVAQVALVRGVVDISRGSFYIPMNQPMGNLVMAALEPDTADSYFSARLVDRLQDSARIMSEPALKMEALR
ncbi:MAG: M14 family metallocarboxypeptidase [Polaromonas sp.]|nr:M14 family metallocarboxypeptidase [Polaromonas sp.]